jgi:hypothetical protein
MKKSSFKIAIVVVLFFAFSGITLVHADEVINTEKYGDEFKADVSVPDVNDEVYRDENGRVIAREENGELINLSSNEVTVYEGPVANETKNEEYH